MSATTITTGDVPRWVIGRLFLPLAILAFMPGLAMADQMVTTAPTPTSTQLLVAEAKLDFVVNISKFLYFGLGTFTYPNANATVNNITFNARATFLPGPTTAVGGNNTGAAWGGAAPAVTNAPDVALPVRVRSNAGIVSVNVSVVTPLTRVPAAPFLPFSQLVVTSSTPAVLPSPVLPNPGTTVGATGTAVTITPTAFANRVTDRSANWTYRYNFPGLANSGVYNGRLRYTASTP